MALTKEERYARARVYKARPDVKEKLKAYAKAYYEIVENRERRKKRRNTPEYKKRLCELNKKYRSTTKYKAWKKAYRNSQKVKDARRNQLLQKSFGITLYEYNALLQAQKQVCAICFNVETTRSLAVDHCHKTGKVRGLLCRFCNQALGLLKDNSEIVERALNYLKDGIHRDNGVEKNQ